MAKKHSRNRKWREACKRRKENGDAVKKRARDIKRARDGTAVPRGTSY